MLTCIEKRFCRQTNVIARSNKFKFFTVGHLRDVDILLYTMKPWRFLVVVSITGFSGMPVHWLRLGLYHSVCDGELHLEYLLVHVLGSHTCMEVRKAGLGKGKSWVATQLQMNFQPMPLELCSWDRTYRVSWDWTYRGGQAFVFLHQSLMAAGCPLKEAVPYSSGPFPEKGAVVSFSSEEEIWAEHPRIYYNCETFFHGTNVLRNAFWEMLSV